MQAKWRLAYFEDPARWVMGLLMAHSRLAFSQPYTATGQKGIDSRREPQPAIVRYLGREDDRTEQP